MAHGLQFRWQSWIRIIDAVQVLSVPTIDIAILGPDSSMTDASRVAQPASNGQFSALLRKQEGWLRATSMDSGLSQAETGVSEASSFAGDPLMAAIALLSAQRQAESGAGLPQPASDSRQIPAQALGEMLPKTGKPLPPHWAGGVSLPQAMSVGGGNDAPVAVQGQAIAPTPATGVIDRAANSGTDSILNLNNSAPATPPSQPPLLDSNELGGRSAWPVSDAIRGIAERVEVPQATDASRAAVLATAGTRPSSQAVPGPVPSLRLISEGALGDSGGRPKPSVATFQAIHAETWVGHDTAAPDATALTRSADLQGTGSITAASGPLLSGSENISPAANPAAVGHQSALSNLQAKTMESPFGSGAWGTELAEQVHSLARDGNIQRAELRLNPAHLGPIEIKLSVRGDETSVIFIAAEGVVREALQESLPRLRDLLTEQGLTLGQARILDHSSNPGDRQPPQGQLARHAYQDPAQSTDSVSGASPESQRSDPGRRSNLIDAYI